MPVQLVSGFELDDAAQLNEAAQRDNPSKGSTKRHIGVKRVLLGRPETRLSRLGPQGQTSKSGKVSKSVSAWLTWLSKTRGIDCSLSAAVLPESLS